MKLNKFILAAAAATVLFAASCEKYDDTQLVERVDNIENKVSSLESTINALTTAMNSKFTVQSIDKKDNGTYVISFTNGQTIEIANGKDGANGINGTNGDTLISSITETSTKVTIVLNDANHTTFVLAKALTIVIGDPETKYEVVDDLHFNIHLSIPESEDIASVSATVLSKSGSSTSVVLKSAQDWEVYLAKDCSFVTVNTTNVKKGSLAVLEVSVNMIDGSVFSARKALAYYMTNESAMELFEQEFRSLQEQWSMMSNYLLENEDYASPVYDDLKDEARVALSSIAQLIDEKMTWATESEANGTLAEDLDEILASFEDIQIYLTQAEKAFKGGIAELNDKAFEEFSAAYDDNGKFWTMVFNSTVNNEEHTTKAFDALKDEVNVILSGISQTLETKMVWATESYEAGTLAQDFEEIMTSLESDIQIPLTQTLNYFNNGLAGCNDVAAEMFQAEYEKYQIALTAAMNRTIFNEDLQETMTEAFVTAQTANFNGVAQQMEEKMTWATESYANETLADEIDELLAELEQFDLLIAQCENAFMAEEEVNGYFNDKAFEEFDADYRSLQTSYTQMGNATLYNEEYEGLLSEEVLDELTFLYTSVAQTIETYQTWANESYEAKTLVEDLDEILAAMEDASIQLTQFLHRFEDAVKEALEDKAYESFAAEYESLSQQATMVFNATENSEEYQALSVEQQDAIFEACSHMTMNSIYQMMEQLQNWAEESYVAGTLANDLDEIFASFEEIQLMLTQYMNVFKEAMDALLAE